MISTDVRIMLVSADFGREPEAADYQVRLRRKDVARPALVRGPAAMGVGAAAPCRTPSAATEPR